MNFDVNKWEARLLLEACRVLHQQWLQVAQTTIDEDEQADYSNDLGQLELLQDRFQQEASKSFGADVREFSRKAVCAPKP